MMIHKSTALLVVAMLIPRVGVRLMSKMPLPVPGNKLEVLAGQASHLAFYGLMTFLPISGIVMGYFGGKGVPFFGITSLPGATEPRGDIAKQAFQNHKLAGQALT